MRVDFYQLSRDPVEKALPAIARAAKRSGERLLVVSGDDDGLAVLDRALWEEFPEEFLAHGRSDGPGAARQPIVLSTACDAPNGARYIAFADGIWRDEGFSFDRAFLLFGESTLAGARSCWKMLGQKDGVDRRFWRQEGARWMEGP